MARRPIIAGNWKMHATLDEARTLTQEVVQHLTAQIQQEIEVVLCPPFTALTTVRDQIKGSRVLLGAQDTHWEPKGAETGEISPVLLKDAGCRYCIVGHSERRQHFGETDPIIHRKLFSLLDHGLNAILCVGETLEDRQADRAWTVVENQLKTILEGGEPLRIAQQVVIAYEPVWAIGTGHNATPAQAQEVHASIRSWLAGRFGKVHSENIRIQYGGSVKPENAGELLAQPDIDGALVGGASLHSKAFFSIIESALIAKGSQCSTG